MDPYSKLIKYGEKNGRPRQNKDNEESVNKLANYFNRLANAMRYFIKHGKKHPSNKMITDEMNIELSKVFGLTWYKKENNIWTEKNQIDWLASFIKNKNLQADDWYKISVKDFNDNSGSGLIDKYNSSVKKILDKFGKNFYPEHVFHDWKFERVSNWEVPYNPQYLTNDAQNTSKYELFKTKILSGGILKKDEIPLFRKFLDYVIEQENLIDIYQLRDGIIKKNGGEGLITVNGFKRLVELAYPEIKILWFNMPYVQLTEEYWTPEHIKDAFEYYRIIKKISVSDLIKITNIDIEKQGWWGLSKIGSILTLLQTALGFIRCVKNTMDKR